MCDRTISISSSSVLFLLCVVNVLLGVFCFESCTRSTLALTSSGALGVDCIIEFPDNGRVSSKLDVSNCLVMRLITNHPCRQSRVANMMFSVQYLYQVLQYLVIVRCAVPTYCSITRGTQSTIMLHGTATQRTVDSSYSTRVRGTRPKTPRLRLTFNCPQSTGRFQIAASYILGDNET